MNVNAYIIRVFNEVDGDSAISVEDGAMIYQKIDHALTQNLTVTLDFQNINLIIAAFLNAAIGQLYSKYTSDQLANSLKILNVLPEDVNLFNKVIDRAKEYFADPQKIKENIKIMQPIQ